MSAVRTPTLSTALPQVEGIAFVRAPRTGGDVATLKLKDPNVLGIKIDASSVYVEEATTGTVLLEHKADEARPIASITKLISALVFLDHQIPWDQEMAYAAADRRGGGKIGFGLGERIVMRDIFIGSLANSANNATAMLARATGLSEEQFVAAMNAKAQTLGLEKAHFVEPTGLDPGNVASARDIVKLAQHAFANEDIHDALTRWRYIIAVTSPDGSTSRNIQIKNTNYLLDSFLNKDPYAFIGGKTGFIDEAGWCIVGEVEGKDGRRVTGVVLGAGNMDARFTELKKALWWAFEQYH
ncbi:MAG: serine hydrolase [bacterium]|nr:serine hydrolase [bacterium]